MTGAADSRAIPRPGLDGKRVLVVDDEEDIGEAIRECIHAGLSGVAVDTALSGEEALAKLQRSQYDLIISDYRMPGMDGIEFLMRSVEQSPSTARVLITAYPQEELAERAYTEAKVKRFLIKPFRLEDVLELVAGLLDPSPDGRMAAGRGAQWYDKWPGSGGPAA